MTPVNKKLKLSKALRHVATNAGRVDYRLTREGIEKLHRDAFEEGRRDGEERLGQQMIELRKQVAELQAGLFNTLRRAHQQVAEECEQALVELSLAVASRLVAGIEIDRKQVAAAIGEAVEQFDDDAGYEILLHPEDLALIGDTEEAQNEKFRVRPSREVTRGGCIVHTRFGTVDARRETKLKLLKETLAS